MCLRGADATTLRDLLSLSEAELLSIPNFGKKSLAEIKNALQENGLSLSDHEPIFRRVNGLQMLRFMLDGESIHTIAANYGVSADKVEQCLGRSMLTPRGSAVVEAWKPSFKSIKDIHEK